MISRILGKVCVRIDMPKFFINDIQQVNPAFKAKAGGQTLYIIGSTVGDTLVYPRILCPPGKSQRNPAYNRLVRRPH